MKNLQIMRNKNLSTMFIADFISSFGSVFLGMCMMLKIYRETSSLITASIIPFVTLVGNVICTPIISNRKVTRSFRTLFFMGEMLAAIFVLCFLFIENIYILLAVFITFQIIFFALETFRAEYLRINANDTEILKWQSLSRVVNGWVPVIANLSAGYAMLRLSYNILVMGTGIFYLLAGLIILRVDRDQYPLNVNDAVKVTFRDFFVNEGRKKNEIYLGTFLILFLGSAASIITLSYIVNFLEANDSQYGFLMASISFGAVIGSSLLNVSFVQRNLEEFSKKGTLLMGLLLLTVLFKPGYFVLLGILFVSGVISSVIMTYYSIEIYRLYKPEEIRFQFAKFGVISNMAQGISRPIGGYVDKVFGAVNGLASAGAMFVLLAIGFFYYDREDQKKPMAG